MESISRPGIELGPPPNPPPPRPFPEAQSLTTGPQGKSLYLDFLWRAKEVQNCQKSSKQEAVSYLRIHTFTPSKMFESNA